MRLEDATRSQLLTVLRSLLQERDDLQHRVDELQAAHDHLVGEHAGLEREHATMTQLYVASWMLQRRDRTALREAFLEICINLVGSEEVALFRVEPEAERLTLVASFGIDAARYAAVTLADAGAIGDAARTRSVQLASADDSGVTPRPMVCVPLIAEGRAVGVLVLFSLLAHKPAFEAIDFAIFDLLLTQGGPALAAAELG